MADFSHSEHIIWGSLATLGTAVGAGGRMTEKQMNTPSFSEGPIPVHMGQKSKQCPIIRGVMQKIKLYD